MNSKDSLPVRTSSDVALFCFLTVHQSWRASGETVLETLCPHGGLVVDPDIRSAYFCLDDPVSTFQRPDEVVHRTLPERFLQGR